MVCYNVGVLCLCLSFCCVMCQYLRLSEGEPCTWMELNGTCARIHQCFSAKDNIAQKRNPPICEYRGRDPVICCTDCDLFRDTRNLVFDDQLGVLYKNGRKARDKCIDYIHNLYYPCKNTHWSQLVWELDIERNCNVPKIWEKTWMFGPAPKIDTRKIWYPHLVRLGYGADLFSVQWQCAGSVISHRHILTAAHCISSPTLGIVTYVGLGIRSITDPSQKWQHYRVKTIIPYPKYLPPSKYHDIALLETGTPIVFSYYVRPACLHYDKEEDKEADSITWRELRWQKPPHDILQTLQRYSTKECIKRHQPDNHLVNGFNATIQMCYGDQKEVGNICENGRDGFLQVQSEKHTSSCVYTILGVRSLCSSTGSSAIYTRINSYVPWIESIVWS